MPKTTVKELSQKELNKSLEKSLLRVKKMLKGKWEKEPGTTATWEIEEGRGRARGSKDAEDDERIGRKYGNAEIENKLLNTMEETGEEGEMAEEEWQEDGRILGPGRTDTPDRPVDHPSFNRKAKIDIKKSIKKAMNKAVKKALKKAAKAERDDDDDDEREDDKMEKSIDRREADIAIDASPFLRKMDKKQKKLQKSVNKQKKLRKAVKKLSKLEKAHARMAVASMELSKSVAGQPVPVGSVLRKSGGRPTGAQYDPTHVLRKSQDLVTKGKITTLDGIKVEEWVNGVRADLPENLRALFGPGAN